MREVSQKWIDNQNKTLRDQGLLRLDFLSAHNNNSKAHIIPMGSDASKSNINEIKDIAPYGAPNKNLAMPNLTGKTDLGNGDYLVIDGSRKYYYNIYSGIWTIEGGTGGTNQTLNTNIFINSFSTDIDYVVSVNFIVPLSAGLLSFQTNSSNDKVNGVSSGYNEFILDKNSNTLYIKDAWANTNGAKFTLQIEQGSQATDYEIPQPNTGYVSSRLTREDGTLTPAGPTYYNLDQPITDLNGHTLREVFEYGQLIINPNFASSANWILSGNMSISNNTIIKTQGAVGQGYQQSVLVQNNIYYTVADVVSHTDGVLRVYFGGSDVLTINNYTPKIGYISGLSDSGATNGNLAIWGQSNSDYILRGIYTYNLTSLGLTHLTKEQMDYWYEVYLDAKTTPIEVNVEDYRSPLNGLTITWSENFGHAVDYSIEYNGEIYTYLNNTKKTVFVPIIVENTPDANFKIRVHKWSQGGVPIRIERVFVGLHLIYKQDKIFSFNKKKYNNVLGLELPQDQINFELSNLDRMFDPLWYNSYFKYLNEKTEIRAYSGFRYGENGEEWIKQGTYYLTDWKAPNNSITATFTARDILNLLDADEMYSKDTPLTLDEYCDIILGRDYKGVDDYVPYDLPVNPDGSKKWNIRKNLAMPDLTGKPEISAGVYRINNLYGVTLDYNINNGVWTLDGTTSGIVTSAPFYMFTTTEIGIVSATYIRVGGTNTSNDDFVHIRLTDLPSPVSVGFNQNNHVRNGYQNNQSPSMYIRLISGVTFDNLQFKLQVEQGSTATDYELPIESAHIPVLKETVNKREALQLIAQSIGCHIKVDDNGNISFIRETYGKQIDVPNKILLTKPEFNLGAPVKKIIVPYSKYNPDPNELEVAKIDVSAGDIVELNHDTPYFNGHGTHTTGSATLQSTDMTWYRSFKAVIGGTGTGQLIVMREPVIKSSVNVIQDISSSGDTLTYENNLIDTQLKASRAIGRIWGEIDNSREVEFELRIDPRIDTFNVVSFPFRVLNLEQVEYMRVDELELTYNGAYKGKIKGVILSNYGGDLTAKTYTKKADEFASGEENLKWHLLNE